jgi:putative ABC transport system permease protein
MMIMLKEYMLFAFSTVRHRQRRSWLTILGIFIGIAAVVALLSVSQGLKDAVSAQFAMMGTDTITIMPGQLTGGGYGSEPLNEGDLKAVEGVRGVDVVNPVLMRTAKVVFQGEEKYTYVMGMPPDKVEQVLLDMGGVKIIEGRITGANDKYGVVVGYNIIDDFFKKDVRIGDKLEINGQEFKVRGRLSKVGNPTDDSQIYINMDTAREIFNEPDEITMMMVKVKSGSDPEEVAKDIENELEDRRGSKNFSVMTSAQLAETVQSVLGIIQVVLVGIAAISLLVGGVGIMNTMYTSVQERTRQIGIMKAIGATNEDIQLIFLVESGLLGLVGGAIGCLLGILMSLGVEYGAAYAGFEALKASVTPELVAMALGFSFFIGMASGTFPARQAAKMNPVDALRYE